MLKFYIFCSRSLPWPWPWAWAWPWLGQGIVGHLWCTVCTNILLSWVNRTRELLQLVMCDNRDHHPLSMTFWMCLFILFPVDIEKDNNDFKEKHVAYCSPKLIFKHLSFWRCSASIPFLLRRRAEITFSWSLRNSDISLGGCLKRMSLFHKFCNMVLSHAIFFWETFSKVLTFKR